MRPMPRTVRPAAITVGRRPDMAWIAVTFDMATVPPWNSTVAAMLPEVAESRADTGRLKTSPNGRTTSSPKQRRPRMESGQAPGSTEVRQHRSTAMQSAENASDKLLPDGDLPQRPTLTSLALVRIEGFASDQEHQPRLQSGLQFAVAGAENLCHLAGCSADRRPLAARPRACQGVG